MYFSVWHLIPLVFTNFVNAVGVSIVCFVERHVVWHDLGISAKHLVHQVGLAFFVGTMHRLLVSRPAVSRPADNAHSQTAEKLDLGKSFISLKFKVFGQTLRGHYEVTRLGHLPLFCGFGFVCALSFPTPFLLLLQFIPEYSQVRSLIIFNSRFVAWIFFFVFVRIILIILNIISLYFVFLKIDQTPVRVPNNQYLIIRFISGTYRVLVLLFLFPLLVIGIWHFFITCALQG